MLLNLHIKIVVSEALKTLFAHAQCKDNGRDKPQHVNDEFQAQFSSKKKKKNSEIKTLANNAFPE